MNHYNLSQNHNIISKQWNPQIQLDLLYQSINRQKSNDISAKEFDQHKTPFLSQICNNHNKEIILLMLIILNLNLVDWHVQNVFKKILFNILVQKKQIICGILLQDNQKIQFQNIISEEKKHLKWLQKKLNNQKIIIIIHYQKCCPNQKQQRVFRLPQIRKQIHFYLDEKQIEKMIDLLIQQDKNQNILQKQKKQDRLDKLFYQNVKSKLETLIKHDLLCKQQLMTILQDQQDNSDLGNKADIQITPEIHEFISKCQLQEQCLQIQNESVDLQIELQKEAQQLQQKGQLEQFIQFEVKNDTEDLKSSFLQQQYKQYQIISEK
ncbi:unnamed protein product [Paramecium pentaurelia]|uniref:Uncharacterized protein n=1 Tax=Paramecium pentaurelia TaxID=43138 RepID=A0A8S1YGH7_9CILI|nr:unnamed protein product [Paramecium pentaurelia]